MGGVNLCIGLGENRYFVSQVIEIEEFGFAGVVEVCRVVRDFIDPVDQLAFQRRAKIEKILGQSGEILSGVLARMFDNAFADFERKIQAGKIQIGTLELFDDAEGLEIVIEVRAMGAHELVELVFARVTERRMADIVNERESLGKFRVQAKSARQPCGRSAKLPECA